MDFSLSDDLIELKGAYRAVCARQGPSIRDRPAANRAWAERRELLSNSFIPSTAIWAAISAGTITSPPQQWAIQRVLMEGDIRESLAMYPDLERVAWDRSFDQVGVAPPLRPLPLVVLSADRPWVLKFRQ